MGDVAVRASFISTRMSAVAQVCEVCVSLVSVVAPIFAAGEVEASLTVSLATPDVAFAIASIRSLSVPVGIVSGMLNCMTTGASAVRLAITPTPSNAPAVLVLVVGI